MDDVIRIFNSSLFEGKLKERIQYEEILKTEYDIAFDQTTTLDADHLLPTYGFEETQYHDLTIMAQDYEIDTVLDALHLFYNHYILTKLYDAKKGPGSLVRSIIRKLIQNPQIA